MIKNTLKNKENLFLILLNLAVFIFFMVWLGSRYITLDDSTYLNLATSDEFTMQRMAVRFNTWLSAKDSDLFVHSSVLLCPDKDNWQIYSDVFKGISACCLSLLLPEPVRA